MCGRVGSAIPPGRLLAAYGWLREAPELEARYNVAPTDPIAVVDRERARLVTWGIDGRRGGLFNLRRETALGREPYRRLLQTGRVVVPVSHFYEWRRVGSRRLPVAVFRADGAPISLAGLLGGRDGAPAVTIITTSANGDLAALHDRMPVVLSDEGARAWVLEELTPERLAGVLAPCPDGFLRLRPASPLVNDVRNDGPQLLDPDELPQHYQLDLIP